jgi:hypothetical protein
VARAGALRAHLTYANVVATLALFIALGGASYAITTLPANSVGPAQLAKGAVTPSALGFPLSTQAFNPSVSIALPKNVCNTPDSGVGCDQVRLVGGVRVGKLTLHGGGRLAVTALVGLGSSMPNGTHATVQVGLFAGRKRIDVRNTDAPGQTGVGSYEHPQLALQGVVAVPKGTTPIELGAIARGYSSAAPGEARVEGISIVATVLPGP